MPINDIIADVDNAPEYGSDAPEDDNRGADTPVETTMRTGSTETESQMLPPYIHVQSVQEKNWSLVAMVGTVLFLARYLGRLL